jgi:transcriptional regulator with XRE-family HTH domain
VPHNQIHKLLVHARSQTSLTQKQLADRLGVDQSRVSRFEAGEETPSISVSDYLAAVGSEEARMLAARLATEWKHLEGPPHSHPDFSALAEIEASLEKLDRFRKGAAVPPVLAGQSEMLFARLLDAGRFLLGLDHKVVYVGEIGVGKTTAVCRETNLVVDPNVPPDLKTTLLDTGGGRTTLCDVAIKQGERFALTVEPLQDEEVYRLVAELCKSVTEKSKAGTNQASGTDFRPAEEVERAIRNMAGLPRPARRRGTAETLRDPLVELAGLNPTGDELNAAVASRLALWRRKRRVIEFEGLDQAAGRKWLRDTFVAINNGRHPDFSLPGKISVTVPFELGAGTKYNLTTIDTRGVDGSAIRPDIVGHLVDPRAVTVLCSKWGSAPDPSIQELLKHVAETEVDPRLASRAAILVVARNGDALSMRHDSGDTAEDVDDGYDIKKLHVADALQRIGLAGVDCTCFDAGSDVTDELSAFIAAKIGSLRAAQVESARGTTAAIDQMLVNVKEAEALATMETVNDDLRVFAKRHGRLADRGRPIQMRLISSIQQRHPRTVWAATRRAGSFWNFDVYQAIGDGAAAEAKRRSQGIMAGLREIIEQKLASESFSSAHAFLKQILGNSAAWEADFVQAARHHAIAIYRPQLSAARSMWEDCDRLYGQGYVFKDEVVERLSGWFEMNEGLQAEFDRRMAREWRASVMSPLRAATGAVARDTMTAETGE